MVLIWTVLTSQKWFLILDTNPASLNKKYPGTLQGHWAILYNFKVEKDTLAGLGKNCLQVPNKKCSIIEFLVVSVSIVRIQELFTLLQVYRQEYYSSVDPHPLYSTFLGIFASLTRIHILHADPDPRVLP